MKKAESLCNFVLIRGVILEIFKVTTGFERNKTTLSDKYAPTAMSRYPLPSISRGSEIEIPNP